MSTTRRTESHANKNGYVFHIHFPSTHVGFIQIQGEGNKTFLTGGDHQFSSEAWCTPDASCVVFPPPDLSVPHARTHTENVLTWRCCGAKLISIFIENIWFMCSTSMTVGLCSLFEAVCAIVHIYKNKMSSREGNYHQFSSESHVWKLP